MSALLLAHPPVPVTLYITLTVPPAIPVTKPVLEFTLAIEVFEVFHFPPATVDVNV